MAWNLNLFPFDIGGILDSVRVKTAESSHVQVDPLRPVAGCRIERDQANRVKMECREDRERLPAAKEQGLQCHVVPKVTVEPGKTTLDLLLYCGPKTVDREVRRAKAYFGENKFESSSKIRQMRSELESDKSPGGFFRRHPPPRAQLHGYWDDPKYKKLPQGN